MLKDYLFKENVPFRIFTAGILLLLTVPTLIQDGMFLDGMLYTCVSHNLSNGIGTFWFPQYSPSYFNAGSPFFQEHPPLVFGIQSLFFKLFGDSMYVERLYTLLTMCLSAFLINLLWKNIYKDNEGLRKISWLPVLIWITIPACFWSYSNNMMENTLGIFALSAVILIYKALKSERNEAGTFLLSGFFIFLATMSKGVPGLFPLSLPFLFWLIFRRKSFLKMVLQTMLIVSVPALLYLILFSLPQSHESLTFYVTKRLLGRINDNPTVDSRFYILKRLFNELLPQIILTITVLFVTKLKKTKKPVISNILPAVFFFSIGLAATAPMILTLVQRGFYLVPSFPYFAIGFSILIAPIVLDFTNKIYMRTQHFKIYLILSIVIFVFAISFSILQKGKTVRDRDMLHDVHAIGNTIPAKSAVTVNQDIANTYVLECYFIRYYDISLFIDEPKDYLMVKKSENQDISDYFEKLNIDTKVYDVYMKK